PGVGAATGRMAALPMGVAYRQEIMQPVGVPSLVRSESPGGDVSAAGSSNQIASSAAPAAPMAYAAMDASGAPRMDAPAPTGPAVNQPVTAVPAGTVQMGAPAGNVQPSVPTMQMPATGVQTVYVAGQPGSAAAAMPRSPGTVTFDGPVVVPGDIAKAESPA